MAGKSPSDLTEALKTLGLKSKEAAVEASGIGNAEFARRGNAEEHVFKRLNLWKIEEALLFFSVRHEV